jgi:hypothetical protein
MSGQATSTLLSQNDYNIHALQPCQDLRQIHEDNTIKLLYKNTHPDLIITIPTMDMPMERGNDIGRQRECVLFVDFLTLPGCSSGLCLRKINLDDFLDGQIYLRFQLFTPTIPLPAIDNHPAGAEIDRYILGIF